MLLLLLAALWMVIATAVAAGYLAGVAIAASRPAQLAAPPSGDGLTTERVSPLPSPDVAGQDEAPDWSPGVSRPVNGRITPSPAVTGSSPEPTGTPRIAKPSAVLMAPAAVDVPVIAVGVATWFDSPAGVSAAGPALRAALGPGWRGQTVTVCAGERCVETVLGDWCACGDRPGGPTVIDLHTPVFAALAPLSRGVIRVEVTP